jgi:tyrosyl-tRNA synthetase
MVPYFAIRHLHEAGHNAIVLMGGGTARIGDPSGKTTMRQIISYEEIDANAARFLKQLDSFLKFDGKTLYSANNKDWLADLNYIDFLRDIGRHFSVNRMLSFESYKMRMETGLSFIEFNYQLLQSYDYLQLHKRTAAGSSGRRRPVGQYRGGIELIRRVEGTECFGLTFPLVTTSDGKKMGKTEKGALFLNPEMTSPYDSSNTGERVRRRRGAFSPHVHLPARGGMPKAGRRQRCGDQRGQGTACLGGDCHDPRKEEADKALAGAKAAFSGAGDKSAMPTVRLSRAMFDSGSCILDLSSTRGWQPPRARRGACAAGWGFLSGLGGGELEAIGDPAYYVGSDSSTGIPNSCSGLVRSGSAGWWRLNKLRQVFQGSRIFCLTSSFLLPKATTIPAAIALHPCPGIGAGLLRRSLLWDMSPDLWKPPLSS